MMEQIKLPKLLTDSLTSVMGVMGAIYCVITAFGIPANGWVLLAVTVCASLLFTSFFLWKRALLLLIPFVMALLLLLTLGGFAGALGQPMVQLTHDILSRFSSAYPNFTFIIPAEPDTGITNFTLLFAAAALVLSGWVSWGVGYRSMVITVAGTLPFLLLCVVINDTPPHVAPLILLLSTWVVVLLAKSRRGEPAYLNALRLGLTLMAVLLLLGIVGTVYPKEDTRDQELPQLVQDILDRLPGPLQNALSRDTQGFRSEELGADTSEVLDLTTQGTRERKDTVMLHVSSTETGILYLRGAAKDIYTGSRWESRGEAGLADSVYAHTSLGAAFGNSYQAAVQVENLRDSADVAFIPYGFINCDGAGEIENDLRIPCYQPDYISYFWPGVGSLDLRTPVYPNPSYDSYVEQTCLQVPEDTREELYALALSYGYDPALDTLDTVAWVTEFVRTIADYQLGVSRQPANFDFAVYFLEESQAGYCVHFATATAVMLRVLEVPARYASGYRVTIEAPGAVTDVTDMDTHAWAEAYIGGLGWIPIESTPGFGSSVSLPEVRHESLEPEDPESSEPSPLPSEEPAMSGEEQGGPSPSPSMEPVNPSPGAQEATPSQTPEEPQSRGAGGSTPLNILIWSVLVLLALLAALYLRHAFILRRRAKRFVQPDRNRAMIEQWAHLEQLSAWGGTIPKGMEGLALKARFSQHEITEKELSGFSQVVRKVQAETEGKLGRWKMLAFRWLFCLDLRKR